MTDKAEVLFGENQEKSTARTEAPASGPPCTLCNKRIDGNVVLLDNLWEYHPECAAQIESDTAAYNAHIQGLRDAGWEEKTCGACDGYGMIWVGDASWDGTAECDCNSGSYWVTPRGRHVLYPGGPFCGRESLRRVPALSQTEEGK